MSEDPKEDENPVEHEIEQGCQVLLSTEDWKNVLALMEQGIKAIGSPAFIVGGQLIENIANQTELDAPK